MTLLTRALKSKPAQSILARLAVVYLRLVYTTTQWTVVRPPATHRALARKGPFIACFWHGRMAIMRAALPPGVSLHMLISEHRDGVLISRAAARLGVGTVGASSKRGGLSALRTIQRLLGEGHSIGITPDGPRGPRMRAKAGAIKAAAISGAPILPISGGINRRRVLRSWDRFCVALPFSRGAIFWGEPIEVPRDAGEDELERLRGVLEERLNMLTAEADRHFGLPEIQPAARSSAAGQTGYARP